MLKFIKRLIKGLIKLNLFIALFVIMIKCQETGYTLGMVVCGIIMGIIYLYMTKDDRKAKKEKAKREGTYVGFWGVIGSILLLLLLWPFKLIGWLIKGFLFEENNSAQEWLDDYTKRSEESTARHLENRANAKELENKALQLESQLKYMSGYKYKETRKQIEDLRREASRLKTW